MRAAGASAGPGSSRRARRRPQGVGRRARQRAEGGDRWLGRTGRRSPRPGPLCSPRPNPGGLRNGSQPDTDLDGHVGCSLSRRWQSSKQTASIMELSGATGGSGRPAGGLSRILGPPPPSLPQPPVALLSGVRQLRQRPPANRAPCWPLGLVEQVGAPINLAPIELQSGAIFSPPPRRG